MLRDLLGKRREKQSEKQSENESGKQTPWEEISMKDYYQIEYLFVGELDSKKQTYISDDVIGINIFEERMFGKNEFYSSNILNLTLTIDKQKFY